MLSNLLLRLGFRGHDGKARPGNLDENGNLKVKVSGTIPSREEVIFAREIRNTSAPWTNVPVPAGAKGVKLYATIWGVTGTFGENEGLAISFADINPSESHYPTITSYTTKRSTAGGNFNQPALYLYPGLNESVNPGNGLVTLGGIPLGSRIRVTLSINGTFAPGEGFDCSLVALWLF